MTQNPSVELVNWQRFEAGISKIQV